MRIDIPCHGTSPGLSPARTRLTGFDGYLYPPESIQPRKALSPMDETQVLVH